MKRFLILILLILNSLGLSGCADMIEIQDRDFVLALGLSYEADSYTFTYALPDLGLVDSSAGEETSLVRTYSGPSFPEIEDQYNRHSDKRLDYRHLQILILNPSITQDPEAFASFITFINENNEISRNVLVYFYDGDLTELFTFDNNVNGSLGDHIKKMAANYSDRYSLQPVTTGNFIDGLYSEMTLLTPRLLLSDSSVYLDGAAVFQNNEYIESVSEEQYQLYLIAKGEGQDYTIILPESDTVKLSSVKSTWKYRYRDNVPVITIELSGSAELLSERTDDTSPAYITNTLNEYLKKQLQEELSYFLKDQGIDYLNLYEKSSLKNREVWLSYENRSETFAEDVTVSVQTAFQLQ